MSVLQFPTLPPTERIEIHAPGMTFDGHRLLLVDLIDADGRTEMWRGFDVEDARRAASGFAEGDGSAADLLPVVDLIPENVV